MNKLAILIALTITANAELVCHTAPMSIYNVQTKSIAPVTSTTIWHITDRQSHLIVNNKIYTKYGYRKGITTYIRGNILIFRDIAHRYYIRKVQPQHTAQLICN